MILAAHQPQYLPWLGFLDKMDQADLLVVLDNVQFKKNEWQNRNRIKSLAGWQWLTVPVRHDFGQRIAQVQIADDRWRAKHARALEQAYARAQGFKDNREILGELYDTPWSDLSALNLHSLRALARRFEIGTPLIVGSEVAGIADDQADERLLDLCRRFDADVYLAGAGGRDYMDLARWEHAGIEVRFQEFRHPEHTQLHGPFIPGLSAIDLLFNCGPRGFASVRGARRKAA